MEDKVSQTFYRLCLTVYSCLEVPFFMSKFKLIKSKKLIGCMF